MKLNIYVKGQKISGSWTSWNDKTIDSEQDHNYNEIRQELIDKLNLSVGQKTGRIKNTSMDITIGDLCALEISLFMPDNFANGRKYFNNDKILKVKISEFL